MFHDRHMYKYSFEIASWYDCIVMGMDAHLCYVRPCSTYRAIYSVYSCSQKVGQILNMVTYVSSEYKQDTWG